VSAGESAAKDRLAHIVREAARAYTRDLTARLAREGVSFSNWAFLRILWAKDGLTQRELSDQAGVMEPTTATALKTMAELGLVERRRQAHNRRNLYVHLTPKGRALRAKLEPLAIEVNKAAVRNVPAADVAACRRTLVAILSNLKP
jgi:DNA-binding MarR family transcriptional regulator